MTPIEDFFAGHIVLINLERRPDRLAHAKEEFRKLGITHWQIFDAIDAGPTLGNHGCSASHRAVMDMIVTNNWPTCAVFEDDFEARFDDVQSQFKRAVSELPEAWSMIYSGGGYGSKPQGWHSRHLVRIGQMKTTSSYGVTQEAARALRDLIPVGTGDSIDNLYAGYNESANCFCIEPRLFVQYENYSDLQQRVMSNRDSMENPDHVNALGKFNPR